MSEVWEVLEHSTFSQVQKKTLFEKFKNGFGHDPTFVCMFWFAWSRVCLHKSRNIGNTNSGITMYRTTNTVRVQYRVFIMLYSDSFIMLYINLTNRHATHSLSSVTRVHNTEAYLKK